MMSTRFYRVLLASIVVCWTVAWARADGACDVVTPENQLQTIQQQSKALQEQGGALEQQTDIIRRQADTIRDQGELIQTQRAEITHLKEITAIHNKTTSTFDDNKIAFSSHLSSSLGSFTSAQVIIFGEVQLNLGSGYNAQTGKFVCPTSGTYVFTWTTMVPSNKIISTRLMINEQESARIYTDSGPSSLETGSNTVIRQLAADDNVWIQYASGTYLHSPYSTFSGFKL